MNGIGRWMAGLSAAAAALLVASVVAALDTGSPAPAVRGARLGGGGNVDLASHRGSVVVVDFWASWCEPCAQAMPALQRIHERYGDRGVVVIGVSEDRTADNARDFLRSHRVTFPVTHDADHSIANRFSPPTMPSTYVIDRQGVVRHVHAGYRAGDAAQLEREIRDLL